MIRNYFTLYHAGMELHERLAGGELVEIFSQHKNEVTLSFIEVDGGHLQIVVVTHTPLLSLSVKNSVHNKARISASLMNEVYNNKILSVDIAPCDREIRIALADEATIVLRLFSSKTNVFVVRDNHIIDAFKQKNSLSGQPYDCTPHETGVIRSLEKLAMNKTLFFEQFKSRNEESIPEKLAAILPGFDRSLVNEMLKMAPEEKGSEGLFIAFQSVFFELLDPKGAVSEKEDGEPVFSLLHFAQPQTRYFESILEGLTDYTIKMRQFLETKEKLKSLQKKLYRELEKKQKTLDGFKPEMLEKFARVYETSGHLLMASLYQPRTERQSITVKNIFEPEAPDITIQLKEALTLQKNAEAYFSKASKSRGKLKAMQGRRVGLELDKKELEALLSAIETITNPKEAHKFIVTHSGQLGKAGVLPPKNNPTALPFRIVQLSRTATLLIGKIQLTMSY